MRLSKAAYLEWREGAEILEADGHGDKVLALADGTMLKLFRRKRLLSSALVFPYARRFISNAKTLGLMGIPVPSIIDEVMIPEMARHGVLYRPLAGMTLRQMSLRGMIAAEQHESLKQQLTQFIIGLHDKGVYFRSLHIGNVVLTPDGRMGLIDFADLRIYPWSLGKYLRARNMRRMQGFQSELDWLDLPSIIAAARRVGRRVA